MYKYIYGTARWLCDNSATSTTELEHGSMVLSELGVPTYYNVPQWSANAVYCDGIGKHNEFNREYSNICFSNGERMEKIDVKNKQGYWIKDTGGWNHLIYVNDGYVYYLSGHENIDNLISILEKNKKIK